MARKDIRVLFIEDNPHDVELIVLDLSRWGYEVDWRCVDTEPALRSMLREWAPDIILSDYSMPAFSGPDAQAIASETSPGVPFIFVSGTIGEERAIESILRGATDYVLKDNLRRLGASIDRALNDARERRKARAAEKERARLAAILEATSDIVVIAQPDDKVLYLNHGAREMLGLDRQPEGMTVRDLFPRWTWDHLDLEIRPAATRDGVWKGEALLRAKDGADVPVSQVVLAHKNGRGELEYFSFIARDLSDRKRYERHIHHLANYDGLTELPNSSLLADRATQAISHAQRNARTVALLLVNIDRFKLVNDGYGRVLGDGLLRAFGMRLRRLVRDSDTVARLSADSFAVLLTELAGPDDVITVVGKLREGLEAPFDVLGKVLTIGSGVGASIHPRDGDDFETLLQNADVAMHRSKEAGGHSFHFYAAEMTRNAAERARLEYELRQALSRGELSLHYQPVMCLREEVMIGVEALMRWDHPVMGAIPPCDFIPLAENCGLILPLGEWALKTACAQLNAWDADGRAGLRMAVNVSARQFRSKGFAAQVRRIVDESGVDPRRLELELTESILVREQKEVVATLGQLKALGLGVVLDDFGTGYSSLHYLSRLPIDCLKIDQSFVRRSSEDGNDAEIVKAIVSLSEALNLRVIAEGIETVEQLAMLRGLNCAEGQGFLFSRAVPPEQISGSR